MFSLDPDCTDLCLIDSGIKSLDKVPLRQNLQSINLHSNYIQKVENLSHLCKLRHLDLSSNQISVIEGLDGLQSLRTINLSCNYLKDLRGLAGLRSLVKLNVSYNQINDISGLKSLHGPDYKLSQLELHGNQLSSWKHVLQCLIGCRNLRQLTLCWDGSSNPICDTRDYRAKLLSALTQLETLDNVNRQGVLVSGTQVIADIPGLEEYMDYLISNTTSSMSMESSVDKLMDIVTPKIDQAIENFRHRHVASSTETSMAAGSEADTSIGQKSEQVSSEPEKKQTYSDQEKRLELLEKQLAELMKVSKSQLGSRDKNEATVQHLEAERDRTDDSEDSTASRGKSPGRRKRRSRIPGYRKSTASSRARKEASTPPPETSSSAGAKDDGDLTFEFDKNNVTKARGPSAVMIDEQKREDVQSTYLQIMKELENERERRWKAEKASRKLLDHIKELQGKATQGDQLKDTALEATNRLKQALMNEREAKLRLQDDVERLKEHIKELNRQLGVAKDSEESYKRSLRSMEEVTAKMERDGIQQQTHEQKKAQDAQMRAAALNRELELIRATSEKQKGQITQLQELLANREQQHREELKNKYSLDSKELKEVLDEHAQKKDREYRLEMKAQQERIETLTKQYTELEDEFRMALQIEANRFRELEVAYEKLVDENKQSKQSLLAAHGKDEETTSIVTELTALVKEQKGRISELSKSKSEQSLEYRERIQTLEAHVEEAKKRMLQMELLKQDKTKLLAQVEAQESVISGLKAERKLWGQELAQQGASLAQDRGRLESKIEAQTSEITTLKKNFERETDALKIKTKMLEDQTETIRKMKEALVDRDEEIKKAREESLKIQKNLEEQLNEERANIQDNQETIEHLRERKQELKQQLSDITAELDDSKKAHGILNNKWKEKSHLIGQLETQVQEMKENWEGKERKLTEERNKAVEAANIAIEKLRTIDDAFRSQLETKEQKHQEEIGMLERDKQLEVDQANRRVYEVEEEMRELLKENEANKRTMEDKVKRLTQAMADIQSDLL